MFLNKLMNILHIINSLNKGGAEGNLYRLCEFQKKKFKNNINITIITLIDNGYYEPLLKKMGIKIFSLKINKKNKFFDNVKKLKLFRELIRKLNPNIIQSWMYHSNFFSLFVPNKNKTKIYWNIRHSELNFKISKKTTIFISFICGLFSRIVPSKVIYCSEKSIKFHEKKHFYFKNKTTLISNGYSDKLFYTSNLLRRNFKIKYKIKKNNIVLGYAGRYAKQKNIESLLKAFSLIKKKNPNVFLFMVGKNINEKNKGLINIVKNNKISDKILFLDEQKNLLQFYNGIDLLLLVSHSESFPNVVAESMLCSTPVLSTDAGCARQIIGRYGFIIKNNDYLSIAENLKKIMPVLKNKKKLNKLKVETRKKIQLNYSIEKMSNKYFENWID